MVLVVLCFLLFSWFSDSCGTWFAGSRASCGSLVFVVHGSCGLLGSLVLEFLIALWFLKPFA